MSSFDSIYKNKVVYAIVKMLHHKKRIVLTHNTDLIRLLDGQYKRCFKLYLLNNTDGELNGFIPLKNNEQEMLISLEKLLSAFRESVPCHVVNPELFLISMIPFMRGYANIICNRTLFESLTQVMHGYKTETWTLQKHIRNYLENTRNISRFPMKFRWRISSEKQSTVYTCLILGNFLCWIEHCAIRLCICFFALWLRKSR